MTKKQIRANQQLIAQAMGVPLASPDAEQQLTKAAREASGIKS